MTELRSLAITAARDGGYYVRDMDITHIPPASQGFAGPMIIFAGDREACLKYIHDKLTEQQT